MPGASDIGFGYTIGLKDSFSRTARAVGRSAKAMQRGFAGARGALKGLTGTIPGWVKGAAGVYGMYRAVKAGTQAVVEFTDKQHKLFTLIVDPDAPEKSIQMTSELSAHVRDLSRAYGLDLSKSMDSAWLTLSSGVDVGQKANDFLTDMAKLSTAAEEAMDPLVAATTSAAAAYGGFGDKIGTALEVGSQYFAAQKVGVGTLSEIATTSKEVMTTAAKLGITFEEQLATLTGLTKTSESVSTAGTQLNAVLNSLIAPGNEVETMFQTLKLDMSQDAIAARGLTGTINMLSQAAERARFDKAGLNLYMLGKQFQAADFQGQKIVQTAVDIANALALEDDIGTVASAMKMMGGAFDETQWQANDAAGKFKEVMVVLNKKGGGIERFFPNVRAMKGAMALEAGGGAAETREKAVKEIARADEIMRLSLEHAMSTPGFQMKKLKAEFEEVKLEFGKAIMPLLKDVLSSLATVDWNRVNVWLRKAITDMEVMADAVDMMVTEAIDHYSWFGKKIQQNPLFWANPVNLIAQALGGVMGFDWETIAPQVPGMVADELVNLGATFAETMIGPFEILGKGLMDAIPDPLEDVGYVNLEPDSAALLQRAIDEGIVNEEALTRTLLGLADETIDQVVETRRLTEEMRLTRTQSRPPTKGPLTDDAGNWVVPGLDLGFAKGGIATKPTRGIIGEDGAEAVIPLSRLPEVMSRVKAPDISGASGLGDDNNRQVERLIRAMADKPIRLTVMLDGRKLYEQQASIAALEAGRV